MSTAADSKGLDLSPTFAPVYWGFVISLVLGGISVVQGYIYFSKSHDRLAIQLTAGSMLVFDFVSSALVAQSVYYYLVPHFGSLLPLASITPELSVECLISTIITLISQLYFAKQLYAVTKPGTGTWVTAVSVLVALFTVFAFAFGVACTTVMFVQSHAVLGNRTVIFQIFFGLAKGFGAITDIVATVAMCMFLASSRTGMNQTNSLINSLIHFILHRGVLVTLIQTLLLLVFYVAPSHLYWLAFHINVTKLYVNTFFAMLNARSHLNQKHAFRSANESTLNSIPLKRQFTGDGSYGRAVEFDENNKGKSPPKSPMPLVTQTVVVSDY